MSEPEQRAKTRRRLLEVVATIAAVALLVAGMRSFLSGAGEGRALLGKERHRKRAASRPNQATRAISDLTES
jgi:hypothetical protein